MKKRFPILAFGSMIMLVLILVCQTNTAEAKKAKLTNKKLNFTVGSWQRVYVVNATPKKVKWSVNKAGKKVVTLSAKKLNSKIWGTSVKVKAKKAGKATLTAKITVGKKTYKKTCRITVSKKPSTATGSRKKWSGTVNATFSSEGWTKVQWTKQPNASQYYVYRKTGSGSWKFLKGTTLLYAKDRSVEEDTTYSYRVTAKLKDGAYTQYSSAVKIMTGKMERSTDIVTPTPTPAQSGTMPPDSGSASTGTGSTTTTTKYTVPTITRAELDEENLLLYLEWEAVEGIDQYSVTLFSTGGCAYYDYDPDTTSVTIDMDMENDRGICMMLNGLDVFVHAEVFECYYENVDYTSYKSVSKDYVLGLTNPKTYQAAYQEWRSEWIAENITDGMTELDKAKFVAQMIAKTFTYADGDALGMWYKGSGSCIGGAQMLRDFCNDLGIEAEVKLTEVTSDNIHYSAIVQCDGKEYVFDVQGGLWMYY